MSVDARSGGVDAASRLGRGIAVFVPTLRMGGGERSLLSLAEGFARRGLPVAVVVHDLQVRELEVPAGVERVSLGARRSLDAVPRLARWVWRRRPGVLLSAFPHSNLVALAACRWAHADCRVIVSEHAPVRPHVDRMGGWRYRLLPPVLRWAYPKADALVAVSRGIADELAALAPSARPRLIHNPVLPADWHVRSLAPAGHPWLADASLDVVLTVSRLAPEKDIPTLVRAFAHAAATRPAARLLIAGDGPERPALERCIAEAGLQARAALVGAVANPLAWMRPARLFVLASRYEGFGNALVEAMAAGTPVVATDCPVGPREILEGGRLGALVPVGDACAMAEAIAAVLDRPRAAPLPFEPDRIADRYAQDRSCERYLALAATLDDRAGP